MIEKSNAGYILLAYSVHFAIFLLRVQMIVHPEKNVNHYLRLQPSNKKTKRKLWINVGAHGVFHQHTGWIDDVIWLL